MCRGVLGVLIFQNRTRELPAHTARKCGSLFRDERGSTAVEFGFLVIPLFMFLFGIINTGYYFFNQHLLDRGVEEASRRVRTGESQKLGATVGAYRNLVCNAANFNISSSNTGYGPPPTSGLIDCSKLTILMQNAADWGGIQQQNCRTAGNQSQSTGNANDTLSSAVGTQSRVVIITACYSWPFAQQLPFAERFFGTEPIIYSSTAAFRTEDYQ